jgi:hypothetical protein
MFGAESRGLSKAKLHLTGLTKENENDQVSKLTVPFPGRSLVSGTWIKSDDY